MLALFIKTAEVSNGFSSCIQHPTMSLLRKARWHQKSWWWKFGRVDSSTARQSSCYIHMHVGMAAVHAPR